MHAGGPGVQHIFLRERGGLAAARAFGTAWVHPPGHPPPVRPPCGVNTVLFCPLMITMHPKYRI